MSYDVKQILELVKRFSSKHFIASGGDNLMHLTFAVGAHAHICGISNAFPEIAVGIYKAISEEIIEELLIFNTKYYYLEKQ
ncbi:MAG: dihydrodipicolinate synthase family protein [Desulfurococcaceae archaeon]